MAGEIPAEVLLEQNKTLPGHGLTSFKVLDTRGKKATVVKVKLNSKELVLVLDTSNEEDIMAQFKLKRGTVEFAQLVLQRLNIVMKNGSLQADFDWSGIRRIQLEAAAKAEKLAEQKRKAEEEKLAKEKKADEDRIAKAKKDEEDKKVQEKQRLELQAAEEKRIKKEKEAEARRIKEEQESKIREEREKRKAFEDTIGNAILHGGGMTFHPKSHAVAEQPEDEIAADNQNIDKIWSDEQKAFYYLDTESNVLSWRDPRIQSVWEKIWDADAKHFKFINKQTNETMTEEPYLKKFDKVWVDDRKLYMYANRETGDTTEREPYY